MSNRHTIHGTGTLTNDWSNHITGYLDDAIAGETTQKYVLEIPNKVAYFRRDELRKIKDLIDKILEPKQKADGPKVHFTETT